MNLFFGINHQEIKSEINIPKFQNSGKFDRSLSLFECLIENKKWLVKKKSCLENNFFFILKSDQIENSSFYFLASEKNIKSNSFEFKKINNFTDTSPAFRCNFKIFNNFGGYSSYQSEYPLNMTSRFGNIISPISPLLNAKADKNYILFRNINFEPKIEDFQMDIINIKQKKKIFSYNLKSNFSNLIGIDKEFIKDDFYIKTNKYLGIPIFVYEFEKNLSMEHTHPPQTYILSEERFSKTKDYKDKFKITLNF